MSNIYYDGHFWQPTQTLQRRLKTIQRVSAPSFLKTIHVTDVISRRHLYPDLMTIDVDTPPTGVVAVLDLQLETFNTPATYRVEVPLYVSSSAFYPVDVIKKVYEDLCERRSQLIFDIMDKIVSQTGMYDTSMSITLSSNSGRRLENIGTIPYINDEKIPYAHDVHIRECHTREDVSSTFIFMHEYSRDHHGSLIFLNEPRVNIVEMGDGFHAQVWDICGACLYDIGNIFRLDTMHKPRSSARLSTYQINIQREREK